MAEAVRPKRREKKTKVKKPKSPIPDLEQDISFRTQSDVLKDDLKVDTEGEKNKQCDSGDKIYDEGTYSKDLECIDLSIGVNIVAEKEDIKTLVEDEQCTVSSPRVNLEETKGEDFTDKLECNVKDNISVDKEKKDGTADDTFTKDESFVLPNSPANAHREGVCKENETDHEGNVVTSVVDLASKDDNQKVDGDSKEIIETDNLSDTVPDWVISDYTMTPCEDICEAIETSVVTGPNESSQSTVEDIAGNQVYNLPVIGHGVRDRIVTQAFGDLVYAKEYLHTNHHKIGLIPFTKEELKAFYFNPELEQVEQFTDQFIESAIRLNNEFKELLETYMKSRIAEVSLYDRIQKLQQIYKENIGFLWDGVKSSIPVEGNCKDGNKVSFTFVVERAVFNQEALASVLNQLKVIRKTIYEDYQLKTYDSQMAKIRIESFIHEVLSSSPILKNTTTEWPVSGQLPQQMERFAIDSLVNIQDCISALFSFKRLGALEKTFSKNIDEWLKRMVGTLVRVGALPDHFFLVNHLLRCPPGTATQLSNFIQFPSFFSASHAIYEIWDSPLLHHFIVMLAVLTLPIKQKKEFLAKYKENCISPKLRGISWTFVDEEREEDENPEESWCFLHENDLSSIFDQFPFEEMLQYLLKMTKLNGTLTYDITVTNSNDIMHILAFSTCLVDLLGEVFEMFNMLRYRQFLKRISRTIRLIVQVVSDHWCQYRNWRAEICGDSYQDLPNFLTITQQFNLSRLQLEFDQFFLQSTKRILESHSFGVCQFLSCMPYSAISTEAATEVLSMLTGAQDSQKLGLSQSGQQYTVTLTKTTPLSEIVFLLTALGNLATSRPPEDADFIKKTVDEILTISFLEEATQDCSKTGKDLLFSIAEKHPFVMTHVLSRIERDFSKYDKESILIFKAFPIKLWKPTVKDMEIIRTWLLKAPLTSLQHQLSRLILSCLNYDTVVEEDRTVLFLSRSFHSAVAVTLVEVIGFCIPDAAGGIQDLRYLDNDIISQVSRMAYSSYNKLMNIQVQEDLVNWAFETVLKLKLHESDIRPFCVEERRTNLLISVEDSDFEDNATNSWFSAVMKTFSDRKCTEIDLATTPALLNVNIAVQSYGTLAYFVALSLTREGHIPDYFINNGLPKFCALVDAGRMDAAMKVLFNIFPVFVNSPEVLYANARFVKSLDAVVHIDANRAGYREKLWQYLEPEVYSQKFSSIIVNTIEACKEMGEQYELDAIGMWMHFLLALPNWTKDLCIQFQLDCVVKMAFGYDGGFNLVVELLKKEFLNILETNWSKGFFSSMVSWISSCTNPPLPLSCHSDHCYYAYAVLFMETQIEEESGLWRELTAELLFDEKMALENAYKKAIGSIKSLYQPPLSSLSIYRWGEQGLGASPDHPFMPIIWQQFFRLFLQKPTESSGLSGRHGIGYKFFKSYTYNSMAKKMKSSLLANALYHQKESQSKTQNDSHDSAQDCRTKNHIYDQEFHEKLASLYQTMALWLDEPRLHDPSLLLTALPEAYKPDLLEDIFRGSKNFWPQYINWNCIKMEEETLKSLLFGTTDTIQKYKHIPSPEDCITEMTTSQKIMKRLDFESTAKPMPQIPPVVSPVPEISPQTLLTRPRLVQELSIELEQIVSYSKRISSMVATHVGLDEEFGELTPDLYDNIEIVHRQTVHCKKHRCTGGAELTCKAKEKTRNHRTFKALSQNRNEWVELIEKVLQPSPEELCIGAVYVENVISQLLRTLQYSNEEQKMILCDAGIRLFYLLAELIDRDIKDCNPAIQFFSSCIEKLGEAFIASYPDQQLHLLQTILLQDLSVSFLAPHFSPNGTSSLFVELYVELSNHVTPENITTVFVLLSKFDLNQWLTLNPTFVDREAILNASLHAMEMFGIHPGESVSLVLDKLRSHLCNVLSYRFPELYYSTLQGLLVVSSDSGITPDVWSDFFAAIGGNLPGHQIPFGIRPVCIEERDAEETLERLKCFFIEAFGTSDCSVVNLYSRWSTYLGFFASFYQFLFQKYIEKLQSARNVVEIKINRQNLWLRALDAYSLWILPSENDSSWIRHDKQKVTVMIHSFVEVMKKACHILISQNDTSLLNLLWNYYCTDIVSKLGSDEVAMGVYHSLFMTLPWKYFCPTQEDLTVCCNVSSAYNIQLRFVCQMLYELNWTNIFITHANRNVENSENVLQEFLSQLLRITLIMASDRPLMKLTLPSFVKFVGELSKAPWYHLSLEYVDVCTNCFSEACNSAEILDDSSAVVLIVQLLKPVCGMLQVSNNEYSRTFKGKRTLYVRIVVTLLTRCSSLSRSSPSQFSWIVSKLIDDIEKTIVLDNQAMLVDLADICTSLLSLLNNFPAGSGLDAVRSVIHNYMTQTTRKEVIFEFLEAASRAIANLRYMSDLLERAIEGIFTKLSDEELPTTWKKISDKVSIPELDRDEFVKECLKNGNLLLLFAYNNQRWQGGNITHVTELNIFIETVQWCSQFIPNPSMEYKATLLIHHALLIAKSLVQKSTVEIQSQQISKYLIFLCNSCQQLSEEKTYDGFLGFFGIGRKSPLSSSIRVYAKCIQAFVLAQIPSSTIVLRIHGNSPGSTGELPTTEAEKCFQFLKNLLKIKQYSCFGNQIQWTTQFIKNPNNCIQDCPTLSSVLMKDLFFRYNAVMALALY